MLISVLWFAPIGHATNLTGAIHRRDENLAALIRIQLSLKPFHIAS